MKKLLSLLLSLTTLAAVFLLPTTVQANGDMKPLQKYTKQADGTYAYDENTPVYYYNGSTEQVEIPTTYTQDKNQFKATWIGTISNLHFPRPTDEQDFQAKYLERLATLKEWNMNAVIFQVRPLLDAFYPSEINPTSEFLSGKQGVDVDYDPLAWMVEEAHKQGLEYHAWLNPYRVSNSDVASDAILNLIGLTKEEAQQLTITEHINLFKEKGILAENNFAVLHPEMVLRFDGKLFLNPGIPDVVQHVVDSVDEIITNYDVDAIHFDDYFYPYKNGQGQIFTDGDRETFEALGLTNGYEDSLAGLESWRRDNVTTLIETLHDHIGTHNANTNSSVQLGISPFGIWEHKVNHPDGSNTPSGSSQSYSNSIYADTYKWTKDESVDYILPQIYWAFGTNAAPYGELARWWNNVAEGTHVQVYVGHAMYKHTSNWNLDADWVNPEEVNNQMYYNQTLSNVKGSGLYGYADILKTDLSTVSGDLRTRHESKNLEIDILQADTYSTPSLVPAKPWLAQTAVIAPEELVLEEDGSIIWSASPDSTTRYYVVYKGTADETAEAIIADSKNIVEKIFHDGQTNYTFTGDDSAATYVITAIDKAGVESSPVVAQEPVPEPEIDWTITLQELVTFEQGSTPTETDFIEKLAITSNLDVDYTVTTNFTTADLTTVGTYPVEVTITQNLPTRAITEIVQTVQVQVVAKTVDPGQTTPENPKDPKPTLPKTGDNSLFYGTLFGGLSLLGSLTLLAKRKKFEQ